ncbi:MAG: hypothetical protein JSS72_03240 [Armatimonadetes bacterium]|nr:hypothetical protein [Armatimonadota bacterium]
MKHQSLSSIRGSRKAKRLSVLIAIDVVVWGILIVGCGGGGAGNPTADLSARPLTNSTLVVFGYNDLGMHCINNDFSEICVLPPANNLRAQVIDRSHGSPEIVTQGIDVTYSIPGNTTSSNKVNFWKYAKPIFGVDLPNDMGLFGFGLAGKMQPTTDRDFMAKGIPITQVKDDLTTDYYQLSQINVSMGGQQMASTQAVVPVSWEMSCNRCHTGLGSGSSRGVSVAMDILMKHDKLHGTSLVNQKPVLCAKCHADPALGAAGVNGVSTLSSAMHRSHASRMGSYTGDNACYSCHPGPKTLCFRDVHKAKGLTCNSCHISMAAVGDSARRPWQDEPRCGSCHNVPKHEYEQPGVLYRDSVGHNGVKCITCHNSPHAITPTANARDNVQAIAIQGYAGTISKCSVCHSQVPSDPFNHTRGN